MKPGEADEVYRTCGPDGFPDGFPDGVLISMFVAENYFCETMCETKDIFLFKALGLERTKMVT